MPDNIETRGRGNPERFARQMNQAVEKLRTTSAMVESLLAKHPLDETRMSQAFTRELNIYMAIVERERPDNLDMVRENIPARERQHRLLKTRNEARELTKAFEYVQAILENHDPRTRRDLELKITRLRRVYEGRS